MKADPDLRIPRRLGSQTKRREFQSALNELLLKDWDDEKIESWLITADLPDGKEKEDGDDKDRDDGGENHKGDNHSADGVAQGVSSDPTGATGDTPERTNTDIPQGVFSNPEVKKAMHPAVTGSAFHRIGAAANKEEYPWFHEFGIPADNYATTSGMFRDIQKRFISRESSSEQVPIPEGAFRYVHVNSAEGLMLPIPTSKSKNREDKCIAAVKGGITWATRGDTNAESKTVKALLSELAKSYEKEYVQFGVAKQQADIKEKRKRDKSVSVASKRR
jgi:hypothetical protein